MSDEHMWLIPFADGQEHIVTVDFGSVVQMSGLRLWNYNKSPEDTYRGVRCRSHRIGIVLGDTPYKAICHGIGSGL